jgi:glucose-6-phosphate 1-dehydrogenase
MAANQIDALVIFGATGDLAKLETFPPWSGWLSVACCPTGTPGTTRRADHVSPSQAFAART